MRWRAICERRFERVTGDRTGFVSLDSNTDQPLDGPPGPAVSLWPWLRCCLHGQPGVRAQSFLTDRARGAHCSAWRAHQGRFIVQASYSAVRATLSAGAGGHDIRSLLENSGPVVTLGELRYGAPCNRQGSARSTDRAGRPWRGASTAHPSEIEANSQSRLFRRGGARAAAPP